MRRRFSGEQGVSVVEAPFVLIVIAFFALGALGFVQIFIQSQPLPSATRAAASSTASRASSAAATPSPRTSPSIPRPWRPTSDPTGETRVPFFRRCWSAVMRNPKILVLDRAETLVEQVRGVTDDIRPRPDI